MAKKVKVLRTKPDDLGSTPGPTWKKETDSLNLSSDLNTPPSLSVTHMYAHTIINVFNVFSVK